MPKIHFSNQTRN